jgi:SWI/SNF-related matrix-associated actin-dependent regulator 1 of chromatin subfamily A
MELLPYQEKSLTWLKSRPMAFLALEQGLGKTIVSSLDIEPPFNIVCPATLKFNWLKELSIWRPDLKVQVIRKATDAIDPANDGWIVNYDILHKVMLPFAVTLIADESHYAKNHKAGRTKALAKLIRKTPRVRLLSGTPANRPIEMWAMMYATKITKLGWMEFGFRYCAGWKTPWNTYDFTGASRLDELQSILAPVMLRLTKEKVLPELPAKEFKVIELDLPVDKREKSLDIDEIMKSDYNVAFEALADILHMNAQRKLPLAIQYIKDILESENKVVVFAHHEDIVDGLLEALKDFKPVSITGKIKSTGTVRQEIVDQFQTDPECRVFIGNIKAAGVGITLTAASRVVFVESSWSPSDIDQCADRCHRIGQKDNVLAEILTIHQSVDAQMLHSVISKINVIKQFIKESDMDTTQEKLTRLNVLLTEAQQIVADLGLPVEAGLPKLVLVEPVTPSPQIELIEVTLDDIRTGIAQLLADGNREKATGILAKFGAKKLSDISSDKFADVMAEIKGTQNE